MASDRPMTAYRGADRRAAELKPGGYRGPDRRSPSARVAESLGLRYFVFGAALCLLVFITVHATMLGGGGRVVTFAALRDSCAGMLVLAGTLLLVSWALTGQAARALDGAALLLAGGGTLLIAGPWASLMLHGQTAVLVSPGARLALGLPALVLLIHSPGLADVDSSVSPLRSLATAATCTLGLLGLEAIARIWGRIDSTAVLITAMAVLTVGWFVAGVRRVRLDGFTPYRIRQRKMGWAMIGIAVGDVFLVVALDTSLSWGVLGVALQLVAAAWIAWLSVSGLLAILSRDGTRKLLLVGELADVTGVLANEQSSRQQLVHDARNVVAAIGTATVTLERHGHRLDPVVQEQLRVAVGSEFARLQALLDTPLQTPSRR